MPLGSLKQTVCKGQLELACAPKQLAHMECLAMPFVWQCHLFGSGKNNLQYVEDGRSPHKVVHS